MTQTIEDCEREGIIVDFVRKHGSEAVNMLFTQWNLENALEVRYEEGFEDGRQEGLSQGLSQGRMETPTQNVENLMNSLSISLEKACELLGRSEDYEVLHQMLQK